MEGGSAVRGQAYRSSTKSRTHKGGRRSTTLWAEGAAETSTISSLGTQWAKRQMLDDSEHVNTNTAIKKKKEWGKKWRK